MEVWGGKVAVAVVDVCVLWDSLVVECAGHVVCGSVCGREEVGGGVSAGNVEVTDGKLGLGEGAVDATQGDTCSV